jgi:hypothetical protein
MYFCKIIGKEVRKMEEETRLTPKEEKEYLEKGIIVGVLWVIVMAIFNVLFAYRDYITLYI